MNAPIQIEYFESGSRDAPLLLIFGYDIPATRELFHAVRSLRDEREEEILVHKLPGHGCVNISSLTFLLAEKSSGLTKNADDFTLALTAEGWEDVEAKLAPFCDRYAAPGPFNRIYSFNWIYSNGPISLIFSTGRGW